MTIFARGPRSAYLDHAASTPVRDSAREALIERLAHTGNPSGVHTPARDARRVLEESREAVADWAGVEPMSVIFTSGGTESNNLAIKGRFLRLQRHAPQRRRIVVGASEHPSVAAPVRWLSSHFGAEIDVAPVDSNGQVDLEALRELVAAPEDVALVAIMAANNETGAIAPPAAVAEICVEAGVAMHCDAVQAAGWTDVSALGRLGGASVSFSGHKIGGPVGVGALVGIEPESVEPLAHGGGQEGGARSGTAAVALAVAFSAAAGESRAELGERVPRVGAMRDEFVADVLAAVPGAACHTAVGPAADSPASLAGHAMFTFAGADADSIVMLLDAAGVAVSAGSSCSAGLAQPSPALTAMGVDRDAATSAIRFSLGWNTQQLELDMALAALPGAVERSRSAGIRTRSAGRASRASSGK